MNSMQLKDKLKNLSKIKNVSFNTLLRLYIYDRFIERLSLSKYKDNFILKGGFYLSILFGVENRATMDIDTAFKYSNFNEDTITKMIEEITSIELDDGAKLSFIGISPIRDEDEYGGFRVDILVVIDNITEKFHVDIATGDPITPKEIRYKYKPVLKDNFISLWAYNMETVLAEKIETILNRLELNGRLRDYYDVYLIYSNYWNSINLIDLKKAVKETFVKRNYNGKPLEVINVIRKSEILRNRWINYQNKYEYAKDINFDEIIDCIERVILEFI